MTTESCTAARFFAAALLFAVCSSATAHEFWVEPSEFNPASGARVDVRLCVGDGFEGWPLARNEQRIERFAALGAHTEQRLLGLDGKPAAGAGLYFVETLLDAEWVLAELPKLRLTLAEEA